MVSFDELLGGLPRRSGDYAGVADPPRGIRRVVEREPDPCFVAPGLRLVSPAAPAAPGAAASPAAPAASAALAAPGAAASPASPARAAAPAAVVLVSAPAGAGKSVLARETARRLGALLWDFGQFAAAGDDAFFGSLGAAHGDAGLAAVREAMSSGDYCVVVDSLDECHVRARPDAFEELLADLGAQLAEIDPARPAVVAFARAETADLAELLLERAGVGVAHYAVDYFDERQAREYVDRRLDARGHRAHRSRRRQFDRARNRVFGLVCDSARFPDADIAGRRWGALLGYAPALDVLARYLEHDDYGRLEHELEDVVAAPSEGGGPWGLLGRLLDAAMERERARVVAGLSRDGDGPLGFAYRDRLLAQAIARGRPEVAAAARDLASSRDFRHSPLLGRFLYELYAVDGEISIPGDVLPVVYESLRSGDSARQPTRLAVAEDDDGELLAELRTPADGSIDMTVRPAAGALRFERRLANAQIALERHDVELGSAGGRLVVGPDVFVDAPRAVVGASDVRVEGRAGTGAYLAVGSFAAAPEATVAAFPADRFAIVVGEQLALPWAAYTVPVGVARPDERDLHDALLDLRRLMIWFGPDIGDAASYPVTTMDTLLARGLVRRDLLRYCIAQGLVVEAGGGYLLRPDGLGLDYELIWLRRLTPDVRAFLEPFVAAAGAHDP